MSEFSKAKKHHQLDDLVQYVTLHVIIPFPLGGNLLPFIILYILWLYWNIGIFIEGLDSDQYSDSAFFSLLGIAFLQLFVALCCFWNVHIKTFLHCRKVPYNLPAVDGVIAKVCPTKNNGSAKLVPVQQKKQPNGEISCWFIFQKVRYIWNADKKEFAAIDFPIHMQYDEYAKWKGHKSEDEILMARRTYGDNQMEMVVPEFFELFLERATAPFFVFQIFSVGLWCLDEYWYYSLFTLGMLIVFECTLVQQQLRNMAEIRKMGNKPYLVNVYRNMKWRPIVSDQLLPGDIISLCRSKNDIYVPCDVVILRGSCIVDESMLTGESVPQLKESLENTDDLSRALDPEDDGKLFVLFGGTKIVQHTSPNKNALRAPDDGCIAYVLRTGFNTSQGKLLRTILFSVKRVTENNFETFAFIVFLMIFAVAAASYVWIKGTEDPDRNRYKLFLECTLILTAIIPPDLPIELSLAVNTSLLQLSKLFVYCTEPFRIPMAGKIQICCFDKTGTLTSDDLMVEGVTGLNDSDDIVAITDLPETTVQVLATCHSLAQLDDGLVGDPLEKATLNAIEWNLTKQDGIIPKKSKFKSMKIYQRYHFSSALKRMSVLSGYLLPFSNDVNYVATVKGAPEVVLRMLKEAPKNYEQIYLEYSRRGARVLALAFKELGNLDAKIVREMKREEVEHDLTFAGFLIISCPLKVDSKNAIKEIVKASHRVVMITGDNPLTACYVAKELRFTKKTVLVLTRDELQERTIDENGDGKKSEIMWFWQSINLDVKVNLSEDTKQLISDYDLCMTGEGLTYLNEYRHDMLMRLMPYIRVYARFAPKQKEFVITTLKALGYFTLMCGDGTNDVGALKHAHVGVSILSNSATIRKKKLPLEKQSSNEAKPVGSHSRKRERDSERQMSVRERAIARHRENLNSTQDILQQAMKEIEEDQIKIVKLGDASIAAPFTSKLSSIMCVCHIIKQGRCTLVTTLQMFKILALNSLISAYCQSVLYVDGVKFSDTQATLQGLFIAACFLFIIRSKPLKVLSKEAPLPNIFNLYTVSTILLQFAVHSLSLIYLTQQANLLAPPKEGKIKLNSDMLPDEKVEFVPNIVNSTVYIICLALQVSTFAVNHKGHPFMENLRENKLLMYAIMASSSVVVLLTLGLSSELNSTFQIIYFPEEFQKTLIYVLLADTSLAYIVDRLCSFVFNSIRSKSDLTNY